MNVAVIPARMGSSRFPGKPLAPILDRPMVEHVYRRTAMCPALDDVFVATCDQEIMDSVNAFGGKAIMTSSSHQRARARPEPEFSCLAFLMLIGHTRLKILSPSTRCWSDPWAVRPSISIWQSNCCLK